MALLVSDVVDTGHQPGEQPSIEGLSQGISVGEVSEWRKGDERRGRGRRKEDEKREGKEEGRKEKREKEEGK